MFTILLLGLSLLVRSSLCQVTVSFKDTAKLVEEGQQFQLHIQKIGSPTSLINVIVTVKNPPDVDNDFIGSSQVGSFIPGGPDIISVTFTVNDDSKPEIEETFTFELSVIGEGVSVAPPSIAAITISASDDAYGVFSFLDPSPVLVTEDLVTTVVNLRVGREKGQVGQVNVLYSVNSTNPDAVVTGSKLDISPRTGVLVFQSGETKNILQLQIRSDNLPENNEEFTVSLIEATQGASIERSEMVLIIQANDAPIRFQQSEYRFEENTDDTSHTTHFISVLRGIDEDGQTRVGSINNIASVEYFLISDTASAGLDFRAGNGQVVFYPGETSKTIEIVILNDNIPEVEEQFEILLTGEKGDVILTYPTKVTVKITANDNPNGVISFKSPDQISSPVLSINEDLSETAIFTVLRNAGTFGTVSVSWQIYRNDSTIGEITSDIPTASGVIVFQSGVSQKTITIGITNDINPEPTERYVVQLMSGTETGGAKVQGVTYATLIIQDSDNYYGTVEFDVEANQQIIVSSTPRQLQLQLKRVGNNQGDLTVNMTIVYIGKINTADIIENSEIQTVMASGQGSHTVSVPLLASAFLQIGDKFLVTMTGLGIVSEPKLGYFNSPIFGSRVEVQIPITIAVANGEIGFRNTQPITVSEPDTAPYQVLIQLSREGTSGRATITWSVAGTGDNAAMVTISDTGSTSGSVVMEAGSSEATLTLTIMPDEVPELDEEITMTLTSVSPSDTQRLKAGSSEIKIVVLENDNPGGIFQFSSVMQSTYEVQEGKSSIEVIVERTGGDLLPKYIQYTVTPGGDQEFFGATNVLKFERGIRFINSTLIPIADGIPELSEQYLLQLKNYGNSSATIGPRSSIAISVAENDDPYGLVVFQDKSPVYHINESYNSEKVSISIPVERTKGLHGSIVVQWNVTPANGADLIPVSGTILFKDQQSKGHILTETVLDDIPEGVENFTIRLSMSSGKASIGSRDTATVTIAANDFILFFRGRSRRAVKSGALYFFDERLTAREASVVQVTVQRGGTGADQAKIFYRTVDSSASAGLGDYTPIVDQELVFNVGEFVKVFDVQILNDDIPEGNETFFVQIYDIQGDLVLTNGSNCTITILANDDAYGVFQFRAPYQKVSEEGGIISFEVGRDKGRFGIVDILWDITDALTDQILSSGGDFVTANGSLRFNPGDYSQLISVQPRADSVPENDKNFKIRLVGINVIEGLSDTPLATFSQTNTEVILTVKASDDPNGRFAFTSSSKDLKIAEDYYPGQEALTKATFFVERRQGFFGKVQIAWEVFSGQLAGNLPKIYDFIFLANIQSEVTLMPPKRRANTGTDVVYLTGAENNFLTINSVDHPSLSDVQDGFSLSVWVQPVAYTSSYLIAKTTSGGSRLFYTLKLTTSTTITIIYFGFSITGSNQNQEISVTQPNDLQDGKWHLLAVTVKTGTIIFYLDGKLIATKLISSQSLIDAPGVLLVGAKSPGTDRFIGYLQEPRFFSRTLQTSEILELYTTPSVLDVRPISGYLTYNEGTGERNFTISTIQDTEEENDEVFSVYLYGANKGAQLSTTDSIAALTILKSDNANGVFGFSTPTRCTPSMALLENVDVVCTVNRNRGDDGAVNVTWAVVYSGTNTVASPDFETSSGYLEFKPGDRTKTFSMKITADGIPEQRENFEIKLLSVSSGDGSSGTTNTSGASIDQNAAVFNFHIEKNDNANGLLQFTNATTPPQPSDGIIPPAVQRPTIYINEEIGVLSLLVVRAQGTYGAVTVEWRTSDGTAKSSGKVPPDFIAGAGKLTFSNGQLYNYINIQILDNPQPEDQKMFYLNLFNPTNDAALGIGSSVTIVINHSDGAYGIFQFDDNSLSKQVNEVGDSGYTSTSLQIVRTQGSIGTVTVTWELLGNPENDIVATTGGITFVSGELKSQVFINIRGDTAPELDKAYTVVLTGASPGSLGESAKIRSNVTVLANDHPYGVFIISPNQRPIQVDETYKNVSVQIQRTYGTYGTVDVFYRTLSQTETYPYLPGTSARANNSDFRFTEGSVRFEREQTLASFNVVILDDNDPENDESVFVSLQRVQLVVPGQTRPVSDSPSLGQTSETYGQIIIRSNDNAHGTLELSPSIITIHENATSIGINIVRKAGTFGQVSVRFRIINGTAIENLDFKAQADTVVFLEGETSKPLPIQIIDDFIPEEVETFYVQLENPITGGAMLGSTTYGTISILPSDDPTGAFEFAISKTSVEEGENGSPVNVNISVVRRGGSIGVVTVDWKAMLNGGDAKGDVSPTSGKIFFLSNEASRNILITVLPDDEPEGLENIVLTLTSATNGGRIGTVNQFTLSIGPNDNPHGIVQFVTQNFTVTEELTNSVQYLSLSRTGGVIGQLRVYYSTLQLDSATTGSASTSVLNYFDPPQNGKRGTTGQVADISNAFSPLQSCSETCLQAESCLAFEISIINNISLCMWFSTHTTEPLIPSINYQHYVKNLKKVQELQSLIAAAGQDFSVVTNGHVLINNGDNQGSVPVTILADSLPELDESFLVTLTRVEVMGSGASDKFPPTIGQFSNTTVTIVKNDNAFGIFRIYSSSPKATEDGHRLEVEEKPQLAVDLVVEREGGNLGQVSIDWYVNTTATTAVKGTDYNADGATLQFLPGQTQRIITLTILDDDVPEPSKILIVQMMNPLGGAEVGAMSTMTVVILENDNVAGVLAFDTTAKLAKEGDKIPMSILRKGSALGTVMIDWEIRGQNGADPAQGFTVYRGSYTFLPGETSKQISLDVKSDDKPETNEEYQIHLLNIKTNGVGPTGAAKIDPQFQYATITIQGSNDPHGLIEFADGSLNVRTEENSKNVSLQIVRKFGAIGVVRVSYDITQGSLSPVTEDLQLAISGEDFTNRKSYVDMADGVAAVSVDVQVIDDDKPEVEEAFVVKLTGVTLLGGVDSSNMPPRLGVNGSVAQVIINANDGTKGVVTFIPSSQNVIVDEIAKNISLTVLREKGTFGNVSVFYYAQSIVPGTTQGTDYRVEPKRLVFNKGEDRKLIMLEILDDDIPEPDETFQIILSNPEQGLQLGDPYRANVTILANDGASGAVTFDTNAMVSIDEIPAAGTDSNKARLTVVRGTGKYGVVNVPFRVVPELAGNTQDLVPMQGYVTFQNEQDSVVLEIQALDDIIPEHSERFTVQLLAPDNGAKLSSITQRTVVINPNDAPNGQLQIYVRHTKNSTISVEENIGLIVFDVKRTQGLDGMVTVDMVTRPGTAVTNSDLTSVTLTPIEGIPTVQVQGWHDYTVNGTHYILMLTSFKVGDLTTGIGSAGWEQTVNVERLYQTTLFKWQGQLVPLQTIETDAATSAESFTIDGSTYLVIANLGNVRRFQTKSRLYKINSNGTLLVIQDIETRGAMDVKFFSVLSSHFLVFSNSKDDNSETLVSVDVFRWNNVSKMFLPSPWQSLDNQGATSLSVFLLEGVTYMAVANNYNSKLKTYDVDSIIYKLGSDMKFSEHQRVKTQGANSVVHVEIQGIHLLVFGNNRGDIVSSPQMSLVYKWDSTAQRFFKHADLETNRVQSLTSVIATDGTAYLLVANGIGKSEIYAWNLQGQKFVSAWSGPPSLQLYPISVTQATGTLLLLPVADAQSQSNATLFQFQKIKNSDFSPRTVTLTFGDGISSRSSSVYIVQDDTPEDTETFYVTINNPTGGAEIGPQNMITVDILSNDNAHGIIEIAPDSRDVIVQEEDNRDSTIQINVLRSKGFFGRVVVKWVATGDQSGLNDITPLTGQVEFANGQSIATITLTILNDNLAELPEVTYIRLTDIVESGTTLLGRGAQIGSNNIAKLIVQANDSPYGVVLWEKSSIVVTEPEREDTKHVVYIVREQGLKGELQVAYRTALDVGQKESSQAISGQDYIAKQALVVMQQNVTRVPVEIVIRQDNIPEADEGFILNITSVTLRGETPPTGAEPSVKVPGNIMSIVISENDLIRGVVQFDVMTNIEGRVDVYEEYGKNTTVVLKVSRSIGVLGDVTLTWQADPREATVLDFSPASGTIHLADGEDHSNIVINILDDTIAENMETFDVKLLSISSGKSQLGPKRSVRVAILKNDSPNGLFRFNETEVKVRESQSPTDSQGQITLIIERIQGSEGVVNVQWRLNAEAAYDFVEPLTNTIAFGQGETTKTITLRTKQDSVLEGEERFRVSLITADNNADISHTQGDATVIILPDPGARGTVSIMPDSRVVYIGEPGESNPTYSGQVHITLTRGLGIYGNIEVSWSLTPREATAFLQVEGLVTFADLQQTANITLQAIDDTTPELRTTYTLQLTSATNGAAITSDPTAYVANVVFVASDYPHGLFEFELPKTQGVLEDTNMVTVPVLRTYGLNSQVLVSYSTTAGTAQNYNDFYPAASILTFQQGENRQNIQVRIIQDDIPEGQEMFYINLTSARLENPSKNNYTIMKGLPLDIQPALGPISSKTIIIYKNDDAEGTIEFDSSAVQFKVDEGVGIAKVPLIRKGGNFGKMTISFTVQNVTATSGIDYVPIGTEVIMDDGSRNATIDITIHDDSEMEFDETFLIKLDSIQGGAKLGSSVTATVIIVKSDFPNGRFGFKSPLNITLDNPNSQKQQELLLERTGGNQGRQTVSWRIMGPNNPGQELLVTNDVAYINNNMETTSGSMVWNDKELGTKSIVLEIKPLTTWEVQKSFVIEIYKVQGDPSSVGDGEISVTTGKTILTISKFGDPNGNITFVGAAQSLREVEEPTGPATLELRFPLSRKQGTGTVGTIKINWEVQGPVDPSFADVQPQNGSLIMADKQRDGAIVIQILPDTIPELTEKFKLIIVSVEGGAEIDPTHNSASFDIKYNDNPHGIFGIQQAYQSIVVDPADLKRYVQLNITRYAGMFGNVIVTYNVKYDKLQSGISLENSAGTLGFEPGVNSVNFKIPIQGNGFLAQDTTFTATLTQVQYLGAGVTQPPTFKAGETEAKISVPAVAANSEIGFQTSLGSIDEATNTAVLTLLRIGLYGSINVPWKAGFPENSLPQGFVEGGISPATGSVSIGHGIETKNFTVLVTAMPARPELFSVHLPSTPVAPVPGGARLSSSRNIIRLEPHGIIRIAANSTSPKVSEMDGKVHLYVQRLYGSEGKIEVTYRSKAVTATKDLDYITMETNAVVMESGQTAGVITIQVMQDNQPEEEETLQIILTHVEKYPTEIIPKISPRLSSISAASVIHIEESNDPYGVISLEPSSVTLAEEYKKVNLTIQRSGGIYGTVSVVVRTVGGGEQWTSQIVPIQGTSNNDTITEVLGNRQPYHEATGGLDYEVLDTQVVFQQGEEYKFVEVTILSDEMAEPDETVIVYLTQPTGGARIAKGTPDGGKRGFSVLTILQNDLSNGVVGFAESSKAITVNEDVSPTFPLTLSRINAVFGDVEVSWVAKLAENSTESEDAVLASELEEPGGTVLCPARVALCRFNVSLKNDEIPEEEKTFVVKLLSVKYDAQLSESGKIAKVTVEPSDNIRGLIQFRKDSRIKIVGSSETSTRVSVERLKGQDYEVQVRYRIMQMNRQEQLYNIVISPALAGEDFIEETSNLTFQKGKQEWKNIEIVLTPLLKHSNPLPKQFFVQLKDPTNGAQLHSDPTYSQALIRIVEDSTKKIWTAVTDRDSGSLKNDSAMLQMLAELDPIAKGHLDQTEVILLENILGDMIEEGLARPLPNPILNQLLNVLCNMMNPAKNDATRGRSNLALLMENLAFTKLTGKPCPSPTPPDTSTMQCRFVNIAVGRWPLEKIQNFQYNAQKQDSFTLPRQLPNMAVSQNSDCKDFHLIEYISEQWFTSNEEVLLSNKIIAFGIKGRQSAYSDFPATFRIHSPDRRIATRHAQCVYFDFAFNIWINPSGTCQVQNDLESGHYDYVDCSCKHLTHYAVKATVTDPGLVGYTLWFYIACFTCMIGMALAVLVHHICATLHAMFSANLLMHMCFACFATQLCYIVAAYTSPSEVLVYTLDQDNYRCIVMGLFMHYFFLTQFTWMMAQAINFWKILVMNDEHTDRKYVFFFLLGWGSPVGVLAVFYAVTFNVYKYVYNMPAEFIYGDVNNNREMCFITNAYAALGGVIAPILLMLVVIGIIFVKAFQVTPQWQAYDDIYRGRYNINEIRTLLSFWAVISVTWLWGGLHMVYGQLWMLILFCIFNILQGILAVVLYTFLRNPCIQQCFGPQRKAYAISNSNIVENGSLPPNIHAHQNNFDDIGSLKGSRASILNDTWDRDSTLPSKSTTMKVKRALPSSGNIYVTPPVLVQTPEVQDTDKDFEDLLFALKGHGNYSESEINSLDSEPISEISSKIDKYEMRRISIADTHL